MTKHAPASRTMYFTFCAALVAICALAIVAQSGRRARNPAPAPVLTPEETPLPTPVEKAKPAFTFIVGLGRYNDFSRVSLSSYSGVLRSCADRLNDARSVKADVATRDMSRADAVRQAKAEQEAYVVWLQLRADASTGIDASSSSLYIEYAVFAPITAKQLTSGHTYPEAYRRTPVKIPTSPTNGDYYLNQAARGAAERILDHFHLSVSRALPFSGFRSRGFQASE